MSCPSRAHVMVTVSVLTVSSLYCVLCAFVRGSWAGTRKMAILLYVIENKPKSTDSVVCSGTGVCFTGISFSGLPSLIFHFSPPYLLLHY